MHGLTQFVSMQNHYNLVYREEEREMNPYCIRSGVALTPWSPLARGILAGAYQGGFKGGSTARSQGGDRVRTEGLYRGEFVFDVAERVVEVAGRLGVTPAQVALAWLLSKPGVTAPVVGASKISQLDDLVAATKLQLPADDVAYLEAPYRPVENLLSIGFS
jgi:aryl-alcohol dehydrogenase-like predicted oxidoreductase